MENLLINCDKDLKKWIPRIDNVIPPNTSKAKQRWKKIIVAVDKPKLADLVTKASSYTTRIESMLGILRG
jgi:hypothetical protein